MPSNNLSPCPHCNNLGYTVRDWTADGIPELNLCRANHPCKCGGDPDCAYVGDDGRVHTCRWCLSARGRIRLVEQAFRDARIPHDCRGLRVYGLESENYRHRAEEIIGDMLRDQHGDIAITGALLTGKPGNGKTWFASAVLSDLILQSARAGRYVNFSELLEIIRAAFAADNAESTILQPLIRTPWLVLDDIREDVFKDFGGSILYKLIDGRWQRRKTTGTIIATNLAPRDLTRIDSGRVADRIRSMCRTVSFTGDSLRGEASFERIAP